MGGGGVAKAGQGYIAFQADVTRNRMPEIENDVIKSFQNQEVCLRKGVRVQE